MDLTSKTLPTATLGTLFPTKFLGSSMQNQHLVLSFSHLIVLFTGLSGTVIGMTSWFHSPRLTPSPPTLHLISAFPHECLLPGEQRSPSISGPCSVSLSPCLALSTSFQIPPWLGLKLLLTYTHTHTHTLTFTHMYTRDKRTSPHSFIAFCLLTHIHSHLYTQHIHTYIQSTLTYLHTHSHTH